VVSAISSRSLVSDRLECATVALMSLELPAMLVWISICWYEGLHYHEVGERRRWRRQFPRVAHVSILRGSDHIFTLVRLASYARTLDPLCARLIINFLTVLPIPQSSRIPALHESSPRPPPNHHPQQQELNLTLHGRNIDFDPVQSLCRRYGNTKSLQTSY
jgi:hypothetical protein